MFQASVDPSSGDFLSASTNQFSKGVSLQDISSMQQQNDDGPLNSCISFGLLQATKPASSLGTSSMYSRLCQSQEELSSSATSKYSSSTLPRVRLHPSSAGPERKSFSCGHSIHPRVLSKKKTKDVRFPLHYPKSVEALLEFLEDGHDPNNPNTDGMCPVHTYISRQHKKKYVDLLFALLAHSNANLDLASFNGDTPLHMAIREKNLHIVQLLVVFGAKINSLNHQSVTPLDTALELHFEPAIIFLQSLRALCGGVALNCNFETILPRLKSFHDTVKIKERLKQLRMKSLSARRHLSKYTSSGQLVGGEAVVGGAGGAADVANGDDGCWESSRERTFTNQSLEEITLADMEDGTALLTLSQRLEGFINLRLEMSGSSNVDVDVDEAFAITMQQMELAKHKKTEHEQKPYSFNINGGSRILFLDGGGIKGLIQIEVLEQLEKKTGRKVTELFDWIVGTSTGAIIALGLVYAKRSLAQLRQLYFRMKDKVFKNERLGFAYDTDALEEILQEEFGEIRMSDLEFPRVIITAVHKKTTMPELHFFNNCFQDEFSTQLVWKVARYTSAAPLFFRECDNYVDGGVLANNPCSYGLSAIQNFHRQIGKKLDIALVVSVGSGIFPTQDLGKTDAQEFLYFGRHWLRAGHAIKARAKSLITLLTTALVESESVARSFNSRLQEQGVPFYRFNPQLDEVVATGETDLSKLLAMLIKTKQYMWTPIPGQRQSLLDELVQLFHMVAEIHRKKLKHV